MRCRSFVIRPSANSARDRFFLIDERADFSAYVTVGKRRFLSEIADDTARVLNLAAYFAVERTVVNRSRDRRRRAERRARDAADVIKRIISGRGKRSVHAAIRNRSRVIGSVTLHKSADSAEVKSHILFVYRVDHAVTAAETAVDYIRTDIVRNNAAGDIIEFGRRFENDIVFNVQIFERCGDNITEQPGVAVFGVDVEIGKSVSVSVKIPGEIQICVLCNRIERFAVEIDVGSQFDIRFLIFVRTAVNTVRECFELRSVRDFIRTFNRSHTFYHGIRSRKSFNGNRYRTLRHERIFAGGVGSENRVTRLYRRRTLVIRRYAQAERHGRSLFHVSRNASVE